MRTLKKEEFGTLEKSDFQKFEYTFIRYIEIKHRGIL
jgi:hypothetical protein